MGEVVEVASARRVVSGVRHGNIAAGVAMRLLGAQGGGPDLGRCLKGIAHVVEQHKTEISANPTQGGRRRPKFEGVNEYAVAANRITKIGGGGGGGAGGVWIRRGQRG